MKREYYTAAGIVVIVLIVGIAIITVTGPQTGKVFSNVHASLGDTYYDEAPAPAFGGGDADLALRVQDSYAFAVTENTRSAQGVAPSAPGAAEPERLVIRNADLTIVVKDPAAKMEAIGTMAKNMGGFVVSSNMGQSYASDGTKVPEGSLVVRIPQEKLDEALKEIKSDAVDVQNESQSGQDVTKEYTDLGSQLKNLEATEQQLTLIMQKAEKTEDVLAVFTQLTQIRGQIEVIKGQMQYYKESAQLSAVSVRLIAERATQPIEIAGWQPQGVARDAIQSLVKFAQGFVDVLIRLALFVLPALLIVLLPILLIFLVVRAIIRRRQPKKPAA